MLLNDDLLRALLHLLLLVHGLLLHLLLLTIHRLLLPANMGFERAPLLERRCVQGARFESSLCAHHWLCHRLRHRRWRLRRGHLHLESCGATLDPVALGVSKQGRRRGWEGDYLRGDQLMYLGPASYPGAPAPASRPPVSAPASSSRLARPGESERSSPASAAAFCAPAAWLLYRPPPRCGRECGSRIACGANLRFVHIKMVQSNNQLH